MKRSSVIGAVLALVVLTAAAGAMLYAGPGPAPGGSAQDSGGEEFPTESSTDEGGSTESGTTAAEPFTFTVDETTECGTTCRDVTATLNNERNETATGVTTYTRIYAGENDTDTDDVVWEGTVDVGTLEGGASHTATERVELSLLDAGKVSQNDGWITIVTTVESDDGTVTFRESRRV
ncbi:hypothetical protein [uncultured Halorubrum sp.]|jgi:hypothetical protein|uniref:hypothetical protein n=1 Tax=uncultured Halorubrum sp. TaxID=399555 RepID=UPI002624142D|nr:hypothetical protein [uncultured Halorubrum sp.]